MGGGNAAAGQNNPLLASVHTQGSLKQNDAKGSGVNINKKENPSTSGQNRVGSINSNPGSTASRGSKYNIH